jgi:hypothetical protein
VSAATRHLDRAALAAAARLGGQSAPGPARGDGARRPLIEVSGHRYKPRMTPGVAHHGRGGLSIRGRQVRHGRTKPPNREAGSPKPGGCYYYHHQNPYRYHQRNYYRYHHQCQRWGNPAIWRPSTTEDRQPERARRGSRVRRQAGLPRIYLSARGSPPGSRGLGLAGMLILYAALAGIAMLAVITFLTWRLTKTKEALFAARQATRRVEARLAAARRAAQVADQRCKQALGHLESALARTGQALTVAGQIEAVSQQLTGLIDYITSPLDAPLGDQPGRRTLPGDALPQAITSTAARQFIP